MSFDLAFVDSIASSPTVRLQLNDGNPLETMLEGTDFGMPELAKARTFTLLDDGETVSSSAYGNRILRIRVQFNDDVFDKDTAATWLQAIGREINRERNILRYKADTTNPVFFRTFRSAYTSVEWDETNAYGTIAVEAEPYAYGLKETGSPVVVNNDPTAGSNGMFFDVSSLKGDVDTPLFLKIVHGSSATRQMAIAVRRRGTVASTPFLLQAESMTLVTDTSRPGNDALMTGSSNNYMRVAFAGSNPKFRLQHPGAAGVDVRGTYRVFARVRKSVGTDPVTCFISWGGVSAVGAINNAAASTSVDSGTNLHYIDLGIVNFPMGVDPVTDGYSNADVSANGQMIAFHSTRVSGTTNLDVDHLLFMPADVGIAWLTYQFVTSDGHVAMIYDPARRILYPIGSSDQVMSPFTQFTARGFALSARPGVTNRYFVLQNSGSSAVTDSKSDSVTITPYYWPRYLYVKPVST